MTASGDGSSAGLAVQRAPAPPETRTPPSCGGQTDHVLELRDRQREMRQYGGAVALLMARRPGWWCLGSGVSAAAPPRCAQPSRYAGPVWGVGAAGSWCRARAPPTLSPGSRCRGPGSRSPWGRRWHRRPHAFRDARDSTPARSRAGRSRPRPAAPRPDLRGGQHPRAVTRCRERGDRARRGDPDEGNRAGPHPAAAGDGVGAA